MKSSKDKFKISSLGFLAVFFASAFIISCGPSGNNETETSQIPSNEVTPALIEELNTTFDIESSVSEALENDEQTNQLFEEIGEAGVEVMLNPPHGEPGHRCDIAVGEPLDTPAPDNTPASDNIVLNPPHGEPGHRCDIAVGAPLDTPPPVNSTSVQTTSSSVQTVSNPAVPIAAKISLPGGPTLENAAKLNSPQPVSFTPAASGKNPPHGQPGHRCDIPVGAPLTTATNSAVTLNPPHGQPGHRCDIPVGEPLPS